MTEQNAYWEQLAAATKRLMAVAKTADIGRLLDPAALVDAHMVEQAQQQSLDLDILYSLGLFYWRRCILLGSHDGEGDLMSAVRVFTPIFIAGAGPFPEQLEPILADAALPVATVWLNEAIQSGDTSVVMRATDLWRRITACTPRHHSDYVARLSDLGVLLSLRFEKTGRTADLDEAIEIDCEVLTATPDDSLSRPVYLANLGADLRTRYERTGRTADLAEAIEVLRASVAMSPAGDSRKARRSENLFHVLYMQYERTGEAKYLDETLTIGQEMLAATPSQSPGRIERMANFSVALSAQYERTNALSHLDEAIEIDREVVAAIQPGSPELGRYLNNLGVDLRVRHDHTGDEGDLAEAIRIMRAAVQATPVEDFHRGPRMSDLGSLLAQTGQAPDLEESVEIGRAAVRLTPAKHPGRPKILSNFAGILTTKYRNSGDQGYLDEALVLARQSMAGVAAVDSGNAMIASNLAVILTERSDLTGSIPELNEAIDLRRQVIASTPTGDAERAGLYSDLCINLTRRFERTAGALSDLDEAVSTGLRAVEKVPFDAAKRPGYLLNLSAALHLRHQRTESPHDLEEAIRAAKKALDALPRDAADRWVYLTNLAYYLRSDHLLTGNPASLDEAIKTGREALELTSPGEPNRGMCLQNLAICLTARCRATLSRTERPHDPVADLDEAIELEREAARTISPEQPDLQKTLINLATALLDRYQFFTNSPTDRDDAAAVYTHVGELSLVPPSGRVSAKHTAARLILATRPREAARLLAEAVYLLPEIAPREQDRRDQQHSLGEVEGIVSAAAALALADYEDTESAATALQLLESGRAVLMSQSLDTRSDLTDLAASHPELAKQFIELRDRLDSPEADPDAMIRVQQQTKAGEPDTAGSRGVRDRRQTAWEFRELVSRIRAIDGFKSFMMPPSVNNLVRQAASGPVVVVNVSDYRSDAIVVRKTGILPVPLPDLRPRDLADRVAEFHSAVRRATTAPTMKERISQQDIIFSVLEWLWDTVRRARPGRARLGWPTNQRGLAEIVVGSGGNARAASDSCGRIPS